MKLRPFSYAFVPGPETHIGYDGYVMFVKASSLIATPICFAVYYDSEPKVWYLNPVASSLLESQELLEICLELFQCRISDIEDLLRKKL